ncbi:hypothetical protein ID866_401 [Astraeus odoratus]|nr:hypothetical protein ID866_401 [Astraeus odoratus]
MYPITPIRISDIRKRSSSIISGSEQTTTIIIIVVSAVGGLLLLFTLYRLIRHVCVPKSAPLPPIQPIAHHRQRLARLAERNDGYLTPTRRSYLSSPQDFSPCMSDLSLPPAKEIDTLPSRVSSLPDGPHDGENTIIESHGLRCSDGQVHHLRIPKLSIGEDHRRHSFSSMRSLSIVPSVNHSSVSVPYTHPCIPHRTRVRSIASHTSVGSRNTVVGLPHDPRSQVKIVLPAPLSPNLAPYKARSRESMRYSVADDQWQDQDSAHLCVADLWTSTLHRSTSSDHISKLVEHILSVLSADFVSRSCQHAQSQSFV